jgi:hypothetical protein
MLHQCHMGNLPRKPPLHHNLFSPQLTAPSDENDESLNRWKASLGLATGAPLAITPGDTRRCIIQTLALEVEDRPDIVLDLTTPNALETLKQKPFIIKEGSKYRTKATFKVQHEILTGLKYIQLVKRKGIRVGKDQEMLGSYAPNTVDKPSYEVKCEWSSLCGCVGDCMGLMVWCISSSGRSTFGDASQRELQRYLEIR